MIRLGLQSLVVVLALLATPALAQSTKDAYIDIKKSAFKKQFTHLAVMPVFAAPALSMPAEMEQLIIAEVLKKLKKSRFTIFPPTDVQGIQDQFSRLYPQGLDNDNLGIILEHTIRELYFRHPVNGLLSIQVLPVAAPFAKDRAQWAGTTQKIKHKGDGLFGAILGTNYGGTVGASAIRIVISDRQGKPVYNWSGGIEVLMQRNGKDLEILPKERLWQDKKRVLKAVKYALKPI
ncbi:MAG: hypothetical protein HKN50_11830 [Gammaproteobacteria bacterium]|nr:hypothetical protein [Gammaproteobacteria bacterium]